MIDTIHHRKLVADGLPRVAGEVQGLGQLRRGRVGEQQQRFHVDALEHVSSLVGWSW
jgi:hypothetical protein